MYGIFLNNETNSIRAENYSKMNYAVLTVVSRSNANSRGTINNKGWRFGAMRLHRLDKLIKIHVNLAAVFP